MSEDCRRGIMMKKINVKNGSKILTVVIAILLFGGVFSVWAFSTQRSARTGVGRIKNVEELIDIEEGGNADNDDILGSFIGEKPGRIADNYSLYEVIQLVDVAPVEKYEVTLYSTNVIDLASHMRSLSMNITLQDETGRYINHTHLTLEKGMVSFSVDGEDFTEENLQVMVEGSHYGTYDWGWTGPEKAEFLLEVEPQGAGNNVELKADAPIAEPGQITIIEQPEDHSLGETIPPPPEVEALDGFGDPVENMTVEAILDEGNFTEDSTIEVDTNSTGAAVFDNLIAEEPGEYQLIFEAKGIPEDAVSDSFVVED